MPDRNGQPTLDEVRAFVDSMLPRIQEWNRSVSAIIDNMPTPTPQEHPVTATTARVLPSRMTLTWAAGRVASRLPSERDDVQQDRLPKLYSFFVRQLREYDNRWGRTPKTYDLPAEAPENFWDVVWELGEAVAEYETTVNRSTETFQMEVERGEYPDTDTAYHAVNRRAENRRDAAIDFLMETLSA